MLITEKTLGNLKPAQRPYFLRDSTLKSFGVKVNPSGKIKYIAEVRYDGRTYRKTLGEYPLLGFQQARQDALVYISQIKSGSLKGICQKRTLEELFESYLSGGRLKERTVVDYTEAVSFYLSDWLKKPVSSITKQMVERRFYRIRDKGINGGIPTYSQATKTMRILLALMNYARADEIIDSNPVEVLKLKRVDRSIRKRENYLPATKVRELLHETSQDVHPVTSAVHLMLCTGLRKNEALGLKWRDIEEIEGIYCV